jgi:hypothetical protein
MGSQCFLLLPLLPPIIRLDLFGATEHAICISTSGTAASLVREALFGQVRSHEPLFRAAVRSRKRTSRGSRRYRDALPHITSFPRCGLCEFSLKYGDWLHFLPGGGGGTKGRVAGAGGFTLACRLDGKGGESGREGDGDLFMSV